ncbi:MAG: LysR family transcriptional regulator [Archangium sp.]|nr:LysR family transcriptional regulator [Archangium sp.]
MFGTSETFDDLRLFAAVAEARSFTRAAQRLGISKQTLSRRVSVLEAGLGVVLLERTTRKVTPTRHGLLFAQRCVELVRLAEEARQAVIATHEEPSGKLRITADPTFGEAFLGKLVVAYARRYPKVRVEVELLRRKVDLVEEGFDAAFRIGAPDQSLAAVRLGTARVCYCASPRYLEKRGQPTTPRSLTQHDCLTVSSEGAPIRWPFARRGRVELVAVAGRHHFSSLWHAQQAALAGLGIALFPEFVCAADLRRGRLVRVLGQPVDVGAVWLLHRPHRFLSNRVRAFIELARHALAPPPWEVDVRGD